jgi:hypothetical protein
LALRLPPDEREKFLKKYKTTLFESYRIVQKEYVTVPDSLLTNTGELKKYFELSLRYVQTLKPKQLFSEWRSECLKVRGESGNGGRGSSSGAQWSG